MNKQSLLVATPGILHKHTRLCVTAALVVARRHEADLCQCGFHQLLMKAIKGNLIVIIGGLLLI